MVVLIRVGLIYYRIEVSFLYWWYKIIDDLFVRIMKIMGVVFL